MRMLTQIAAMCFFLGSLSAQNVDTTSAETTIPQEVQDINLDSLIQYSIPIVLPDSMINSKHVSNFGFMMPKAKNGYFKAGLITTTIVANWTSFYLKREADGYYRKYKRASDRHSIKKYYDKTTTYDNMATAALIISGSALSLYIYYLFTD